MIHLSYNGELYSYDGKTSTTVTALTNISVTIHPYEDITGASLYYKQGDVDGIAAIAENVAEIPGAYLVTGDLQVAIKLSSGVMSNLFTIGVTKINSSGEVTDDDIQFTLDNKKRLILVPGSQMILAIQFDSESEIVTFKFPRYQEEVDLSTKIAYVNYRRPKTDELGKSICTIDKVEEDIIYFSWLIDEAVTQNEGTIQFQVEFSDSAGYRWQSQIGELPILKSLYNTGLEPYDPGILEQYLHLIESMYTAYHVPPGGSRGQALVKASDTDYDLEWSSSGGSVSPYTSNPESLGVADPGSSANFSRGDHVHPMPSASDVGAEPAIEEVTVATDGAVSQALDTGTIYHFTGALTALTVTATDPTVGTYQFDFISGSTAPTLTVPASWVMPDNFLVEPNARYRLSIQNGYCSSEKWSDSHSPFIYLSSADGDFVINDSGISDGNVYANVGSEVVAVSIGGKLKNQLANNTWLKICDVSANAKALIGSTYVESYITVGSGKVAQCAFNTWESASEIKFKNNTGAALAANTLVSGTIFIMRTL